MVAVVVSTVAMAVTIVVVTACTVEVVAATGWFPLWATA